MKKLAIAFSAIAFCAAILYAQTARVGPLQSNDATNNNYRQERTGALCFQQIGLGNRERVARGNMYFASAQGVGVAPGTALGTTAMLSVYNPTNSGHIIYITRVYAPYFSGTLGTGTLYHCINGTSTQTAPSGGTLLANTPALGSANVNTVASVRTGSTVVQPTIVAPFMYLAPELATTATAPQQSYEDLADAIALLPGTSYQLQAVAAAGTSPLLAPAVYYEDALLLNGQP